MLFVCLCLVTLQAQAQNEKAQLAQAQRFADSGDYEKAILILKAVYDRAPFDKNLYDNYLDVLMRAKKYEDAASLVEYMMQIRRNDPVLHVDLAEVLEAQRKHKQAQTHYGEALKIVGGDELRGAQLAKAFENAGKLDYAVKVYEGLRERHQNPYMYATQLALLFSKMGKEKEAVKATLDLVMVQPNTLEEVKESLVRIVDQQEKSFALIQKELAERVKNQPGNPFWHELVSWIFVQKEDYEGAYQQLVALDKSLDESGRRLIPFAAAAAKDKQFGVAKKSYDYVLLQGQEQPFYQVALRGKTEVMLAQFKANWPGSKPQLGALLQTMVRLFDAYPAERHSELWRQYAMVQARYNDAPDTAIKMLEMVVDDPRAPAALVAACKLDIGDYYVLKGEVWDAALIYAQVDKAFKQDHLGELARFKNARLAYYRGDFEWAQAQLSVLKASTTKLIANDALDLSVLITENRSEDSVNFPLQRFAAADLLLFQHKTAAADLLLDSISKAYPQNPLQDDILLLRSKIALEEGKIERAISFLAKILQEHGTDVLADDAVFQLAHIYLDKLNEPEKAISYLETLIIDYPGSTFVQEARRIHEELSKKKRSKPLTL